MQTVTKRELVQRIAESTGVQQIAVKEVIQSFLDEIINELATGNRLEFRDFGVFEPKSKAQRIARNPRTGAKVQVPEKTTVKFKVGRLMKKKIQEDEEAAIAAAEAALSDGQQAPGQQQAQVPGQQVPGQQAQHPGQQVPGQQHQIPGQ